LTALAGALLLSQTAAAQNSAIYRDNVITIPNGSVITEDGVAHFRDIRLVEQEDGSFRVAAAERGEIAQVDSVEVNALADGQVEVSVKVAETSACVDLLEATTFYNHDIFTVVLAETPYTAEVDILILEFDQKRFRHDSANLAS